MRSLYTFIILLVPTCYMMVPAVVAQDDEEGFEVLFDGSNLDNWRGYGKEEIGKGWSIAGESLQFDGTGGGDIITKETYSSFDLRFDWKVDEGANSGVMYRVSLGDNAPYFSGPEYQILDDENHANGKDELTSAGALYGLYPAKDKKLERVGQWNSARIVVEGNKIEHWINDVKVVSAEIGSDDWNDRVNKSKFKKWEKFGKNDEGHIAFQDHGDKVWFQNIRIKPLNKLE